MSYPLTPITAFDGLPEPQRDNPDTFADWGDTWVDAEAAGAQQHNVLAGQVNVMATAADAAATAADASEAAAAQSVVDAAAQVALANAAAQAAATTAGAAPFNPATNYAQYTSSISLVNLQTYRRKVAGVNATDPANDPTNWSPVLASAFSVIEVLSISANTSLTLASKNVVRVASTVRAASVLLPSGTSIAGQNGMYIVKNIGDFALPVRDQDGNLLSILPKGATGIYTLEDASSSAGGWGVIAPESRPAMAYAVATVEAAAMSWAGISDIPGVANKALLAWITGTSLKVAIATRNATTGAVTVGTPLTLTSAISQANMGMVKALSSTTALAAGSPGANTVYSLTLNTGTDTVTTTGNASSGTPPTQARYEHVQQLDATRVAWLTMAASTLYLNIATYAATPTLAQQNVSATPALDPNTASILHVGGGNILGVSNLSTTMFTTSGNVATQVSTLASSQTVIGNGAAFGFAAGVGNRATFGVTGATSNTYVRDYSFAVEPSGTTIPATGAASKVSGFPSLSLDRASASGFVAGTSYCMMSGEATFNPGLSLRVMRLTDLQLTEVASGGVEGLPSGFNTQSLGAITRAASVSGQACIAVNRNRSSHPQVFSMEVIKA